MHGTSKIIDTFDTYHSKGHFKKDCPNRKVMFINEETGEYETDNDDDPDADDDEGYNSEGGMDAFDSPAPTIVVSQRALSVQEGQRRT